MILYRNATANDAAALARLGADSFIQTFGHLYAPADLALFLAKHSAEAWAGELAHRPSQFASRRRKRR